MRHTFLRKHYHPGVGASWKGGRFFYSRGFYKRPTGWPQPPTGKRNPYRLLAGENFCSCLVLCKGLRLWHVLHLLSYWLLCDWGKSSKGVWSSSSAILTDSGRRILTPILTPGDLWWSLIVKRWTRIERIWSQRNRDFIPKHDPYLFFPFYGSFTQLGDVSDYDTPLDLIPPLLRIERTTNVYLVNRVTDLVSL